MYEAGLSISQFLLFIESLRLCYSFVAKYRIRIGRNAIQLPCDVQPTNFFKIRGKFLKRGGFLISKSDI